MREPGVLRKRLCAWLLLAVSGVAVPAHGSAESLLCQGALGDRTIDLAVNWSWKGELNSIHASLNDGTTLVVNAPQFSSTDFRQHQFLAWNRTTKDDRFHLGVQGNWGLFLNQGRRWRLKCQWPEE